MKSFLFIFLLVSSANVFSVDWQGHRGARGLYPENTIGAMEEALKYPVTTLELDVVLSKDMDVVVSHEPWMHEEICLDLDRKEIKGKKHNIFKMSYDEIKKYDCGSLLHKRFPEQKKVSTGKPLLTSLIDLTESKLKELNRTEIPYNIEIKSTPEDEQEGFQPDIKTFSDVVIKTIKNKLPVNKFTIQSFDWRVLKYIHEAYPDVKLVALSEEKMNPEKVVKLLGFKPYVFSPYFKELKKKHLTEFQKMGVKVIPWTVNEVQDMKEMLDMGVDGIITDYPNRIEPASKKNCKKGENLFENRCVKVPTHGVPSVQSPGWDCKSGYVQKRSGCTKMSVPKNGKVTADGKNWECLEGFKRYRSKCIK